MSSTSSTRPVRANKSRKETARLNCRVSSSIKQRAEQAASVLGQSITGFTEQALSEKADAVLSQVERLQLSERDFARFAQVINRPPGPTPELRKAAEEYRRLRDREPEANW